MNKLKFMSLLLGLVAAFSFASCNDNDDSLKPLTKEEKALCYKTISGNYAGKLVYATGETKNGKTVTDTLNVTWNVPTDSTLIIKDVPASIFAVYVTNAELKQALQGAAAQDLTCKTSFYQTSPVAFFLNPVTTTYTLNYGGKDHKVQVVFYTNYTHSFGAYYSDKKQLQMQIIEGAIYIDEKKSDDLKNGSSFYIYGTKL